MDTQWIDKIDVVKRQIKESVRLFFEERDPVAIHTLIASAHQILFDLGKIKGIESLVKNTKALKDDKIKDFLRGINYPFNFFKHADRDPDSKINVTPLINLTEDLMLDAIILDQRINGSISFEAKIFWLWFVSKHKEGFDNLPEDSEIRKMQKQNLADWEFPAIREFIRLVDIFGGIEEATKAFSNST